VTRFLDVDALLPQLERVGFKVKDPGLLGSALARPEMTIYGQDAYPTLWEKAAALFESIIRNHPMFDGNKRTAWISVNIFLQLNGHKLRADANSAFKFVLGVANKELELKAAAKWLDGHSAPSKLD
jgi:death-on-curing protein